jgi:hypothetical protein
MLLLCPLSSNLTIVVFFHWRKLKFLVDLNGADGSWAKALIECSFECFDKATQESTALKEKLCIISYSYESYSAGLHSLRQSDYSITKTRHTICIRLSYLPSLHSTDLHPDHSNSPIVITLHPNIAKASTQSQHLRKNTPTGTWAGKKKTQTISKSTKSSKFNNQQSTQRAHKAPTANRYQLRKMRNSMEQIHNRTGPSPKSTIWILSHNRIRLKEWRRIAV